TSWSRCRASRTTLTWRSRRATVGSTGRSRYPEPPADEPDAPRSGATTIGRRSRSRPTGADGGWRQISGRSGRDAVEDLVHPRGLLGLLGVGDRLTRRRLGGLGGVPAGPVLGQVQRRQPPVGA